METRKFKTDFIGRKIEEVYRGDDLAYTIYNSRRGKLKLRLEVGQEVKYIHIYEYCDYFVLKGKVVINGKKYGPKETVSCSPGETFYCKNENDSYSVILYRKRKVER